MTHEEYVEKIHDSIILTDDDLEVKTMQDHRAEVEEVLKAHFGPCRKTVRYGGSKAKGTMINVAYDLDIVCYFDRDENRAGETLKAIYTNTVIGLREKYVVEEKGSALRVLGLSTPGAARNYHIDVVPGRFVDDKKEDANLYRSTGEKDFLKTNIDKHIKHISQSGVRRAIRLMKYWRYMNHLSIRHFVLELLVIKLLEGKADLSLSEQLTHVWTQMRDSVNSISVEDPANPNGNKLDDIFDPSIKTELSNVARATIAGIESSGWTSVYGQAPSAAPSIEILKKAAVSVPNPTKPWTR